MYLDFFMWAGGVVITGLFSLIGWAFKMIHVKIDKNSESHNELETRFDAHRLYAAEIFATKHEVSVGFDRVISHLNRIEDKLDRKVDK